MACANDTKCVDGETDIIVWRIGGMLSSGVLLPESMFIGMATSIYSNPSCGMDRAIVARKMPTAVAKKR